MDDPDKGEAADPDQSASWGGFQIWVRSVNLCAHREQGERIESVYWYLLPMLEWFLLHWDPLLHEERLPCHIRDSTGWRALRRSPVAPFETDEVQEDRREAEWQGWWSRQRPRLQERLMWIAGLGTDAQTMRRRWRAIRQHVSNALSEQHGALFLAEEGGSRLVVEGSSHAALMFGSLNPRVERADVMVLCKLAMHLTSSEPGDGRWATFALTEPIASEPVPWAQGYRLADALHEKLDGDYLTGEYVDVEQLLRQLDVTVERVSLTDPDIRGGRHGGSAAPARHCMEHRQPIQHGGGWTTLHLGP